MEHDIFDYYVCRYEELPRVLRLKRTIVECWNKTNHSDLLGPLGQKKNYSKNNNFFTYRKIAQISRSPI